MRRELAGIEPTPTRPNGAGYASLNLSATAGIEGLGMRRKRSALSATAAQLGLN